MKLTFLAVLLFSMVSLAANKVVQKTHVVDEKIVAADGCSITGDFIHDPYSSTQYRYTVTMKIKLLQKQDIYLVNIKKTLFGKTTETLIPNSTKPGPDKTIASTRSITFDARFPTEVNRLALLKACEDESLFINTGAYPPPPPKPPEEPKKPVTPPTTPTTPTTPVLPGLPNVPGTTTDPLFPIEVLPGNPADLPTLPLLPGETTPSTKTVEHKKSN